MSVLLMTATCVQLNDFYLDDKEEQFLFWYRGNKEALLLYRQSGVDQSHIGLSSETHQHQ